MVRMGRYVVMYPILFFAPRSNWKGGKDAFNEHGYASKLGDMLGVYILLIIYVRSFAKWLVIRTSSMERYVLLYCLSLYT
jgi:hypothetical protein